MSYLDSIKDFDKRYYFSKKIPIPSSFPELFPLEDRIARLTKVRGIFNPEDCQEYVKALRASPECSLAASFKEGARKFYICAVITPYPVEFCNGKVNLETFKAPEYIGQIPIIRQIMITAMERLAAELHWKDTTQYLACNAIDYQLFGKDTSEPLTWHCDGFESKTKHSFVVLLSDPNDVNEGWTGGNFQYTAARAFKRPEDFDLRVRVIALQQETRGELFNDPASPIWEITPSYNDGILFGNQGMQHKITAPVPIAETGNRMILTVFDYGTPAEYEEGQKQMLLRI